jgi:hypothetical protein
MIWKPFFGLDKATKMDTRIIRFEFDSTNKLAGTTNTSASFRINIPTAVGRGQVFLENLSIINANHDPSTLSGGAFSDAYVVRVESNLAHEALSFNTRTGCASNCLKIIPLTPSNCHGSELFLATTLTYVDSTGTERVKDEFGSAEIGYMDLLYMNQELAAGSPIQGLNLQGLTFDIRFTNNLGVELPTAKVAGFSGSILIIETLEK